MKLKDKVAVVTGASSGIGKAIATKLSAEGCKVALASRSVSKMEEIGKDLPTETLAVRMDVTDTESVQGRF